MRVRVPAALLCGYLMSGVVSGHPCRPPITLIIVRPREDVARTFEHRRGAYVDFYEALRDMIFLIYNHGMGLSDEPEDQVDDEPGDDEFGTLPFDFQLTTFRKLQHLRLYAAPPEPNEVSRAFYGRLSRSSGRRVSTHGTRSFRGLLTDRAPAGSPVTGLLMGCRARLGVST
jgi:hypothetical protein